MTEIEMQNLYGGKSVISGSLINSIARIGELFFQVGQALGSSIRRIKKGKMC